MSKLIKKITAIATSMTLAVMLIGPAVPAQATTADELQATINSLLAQVAALQAQLNAASGSTTSGTATAACAGITFTRNLQQTMTGGDVKCLQSILNQAADTQVAASGVGSAGNESTYFGGLTKAAVVKYQQKNAAEVLTPLGLTVGTGFVGAATRAKLNAVVGTGTGTVPGTGGTVIPGATGIKLSLASDTPAAAPVAVGSYDLPFTKINFTAGSDKAYTISQITLRRGGVSADTDVKDIKLFDGSTQVGSTQALNTVTHKVTFTNLNLAISAGATKTLTIKATIPAGSATSNAVKLGVDLDTDILAGGATITGAPIYGNAMSIAGVSVGTLNVDVNSSPDSQDVISGATDQQIASFRFVAGSAEGFDVKKIMITNIGSAGNSDVLNLKLKYAGTQVGSTVSSLTNNTATFEGNPMFTLNAGATKDIDVYMDIASGITVTRTVKLQIADATDVLAYGQNTGGAVVILHNSGSTFAAESQGTGASIKQGTLTVSWDSATNPAATSYVIGSSQNTIASFKFSAGSGEGVAITKLRLTKTNGGSGTVIDDSEFQNVQLYVNGSAVSTGHVGSISSGIITFTDGNGLFTIPKSGNTVVIAKADITTAADNADKLGFYLDTYTDLEMKGTSSGAKIYADSSSITSMTAVDDSTDATIHTVVGYGNLIVSNAPDTPAGVNLTVGQSGIEVLKFRLAAEYEDMVVSTIKVRFYNDAAVAASANDTEATSTGYISNVKLYDGATLLKDASTPSAGYVNFSVNLTVPKNVTKTLSVKVDIPTSSNLQYLGASVAAKSGDSITCDGSSCDEITATGFASGQSIYGNGGAVSNTFTLQTPTLAVAAATAPPLQSLVTNSTGAWIGRLQLTGAYEDIKVTRVTVGIDDSSSLYTISSANLVFSNLKLYNGSTQVGTTKQITDGSTTARDTIVFDSIENLTVPKSQTISLDIKADLTATSSDTAYTTWYVGVASTADVVGAGVSSNTSVSSTGASQASAGTVVRSAGTLTVAVDADTPVASNISVGLNGATGIVFGKLKFSATYEDMKVTTLKLTLTDSGNVSAAAATTTAGSYDLDKVYLYDGATLIASAPIGSSSVTFTNDTGLFTVPNMGSKVITVKADVFGIVTGALSGDSPLFYIASNQDTTQIQGLGVNSNASTSATDGSPNPETYSNFGGQFLYKTIITVNKNSASPSGAATAGAGSEVLRFDVTADAGADAYVNAVAVQMTGTADVSTGASGNASLYKSTDLTTALATETYKYITVDNGATTYATTTTTGGSDSLGFQGIPIGATIHIRDIDTPEWFSTKVTQVEKESAGLNKITFSAISEAITTGDIIYYQPMQPGSGKTYFGGLTRLNADTAQADTSITVDSTNGFAVGDTIVVAGYDSSGNATNTATLTVGTTTATVIYVTTPVYAAIDYNYGIDVSATDSLYGRGIVYTNNTGNYVGTVGVGDGVSAGTTKTYVVKGDTTGAASTKTIRCDIAAVGDLNWDDGVRNFINERTKNLPLTGGTLTY